MPPRPSLLEIFLVALRLGCTSFVGPVAHLAYFRKEYVEKRGWLDEAHFADLVALCQFLPGPAVAAFVAPPSGRIPVWTVVLELAAAGGAWL